jgi:hypothetical protein
VKMFEMPSSQAFAIVSTIRLGVKALSALQFLG